MLNEEKSTTSAGVKILALLALALGGLFILAIITAAVKIFLPGIDIQSDPTALNIIQAAQAIGMFILPALFAVWMFQRNPLSFMAMNTKPSTAALGVVVAFLVLSLPAMNWLVEWNKSIELPAALSGVEQYMKATEQAAEKAIELLTGGTSWGSLICMIFVIGFLAGLSEEMFFRGAMLRFMSPTWKENHVAVWVVAIVFSAIHLQFYGFFPRLVLGVWLGYLLVWTRNLWVPIISHTLNNSMVVVFTFMANRGIIEESALDNFGIAPQGQIPWLAISSAIATFALIIIARKKFLKKNGTK